jgi:hypothetical protein
MIRANDLPLILFTAIGICLLTADLQVSYVYLFDNVLELRHSLDLLILTKVRICSCHHRALTIRL